MGSTCLKSFQGWFTFTKQPEGAPNNVTMLSISLWWLALCDANYLEVRELPYVSRCLSCVYVSVSLAELSEKSPTHCFVSRATLGSSNGPEGQTVQTSTRWQEKMTQLAFQKMPHLCFWLIHIVWKNILAKFEAVVILTASYVGSPHGYR